MSLAVAAGTGEHRDLAGALHAYGAAFKAGAAARLHKGRDAHADQLAARPRRIALSDELIVVGETQRFRERLLVVARVVFNAHARSVRELLGPNEVFAPNFQTVQAELARRFIDQALDVEHRLRPAGAAIRSGGDGVGKDRDHLDVAVVDLIAARGHAHHALRRNRRDGVQIGAEVRDHTDFEAQHRAVLLERQLGGHGLVAALNRGEEILAARGDPLDRPAQLQRQVTGQHFLAVERALAAEARRRRRARSREC